MLFTTNIVNKEELNSINNFFNEYEKKVEVVDVNDIVEETPVTKYISSLVTSQYQKSVEDIENTKIGNRVVRKRSLQQVMRESFFYGANRFGNNFIA